MKARKVYEALREEDVRLRMREVNSRSAYAIKLMAHARGMTTEEVGRKLGLSTSAMGARMRGETPLSLAEAVALADRIFRVPLSVLTELNEPIPTDKGHIGKSITGENVT